MDEIMVSVFCWTYNHEPYIRDCLNGFVSQKTNFKFEVIIHDDASTDKTTDIIKEYEAKYPDIIKATYQKENQTSKGVEISRNFMLPYAKGKYIAMCEGDDYWCDENKLQKQFDYLQAHPDYTACVHNTLIKNYFDESERNFCLKQEDCNMNLDEIVLNFGAMFHTSSVMVRKEYYMYPKEFKGSVGDYPRAIYCALKGNVHYFSDVMSVYRVGTIGSWTYRNKADEKNRSLKIRHDMIAQLKRIDKYSEYKYHELFIHRQTVLLANSHEYRSILKNREYRRAYFKHFNFKHKVVFVCGCVFPQLTDQYFNKNRSN